MICIICNTVLTQSNNYYLSGEENIFLYRCHNKHFLNISKISQNKIQILRHNKKYYSIISVTAVKLQWPNSTHCKRDTSAHSFP